MTRIFNDTFEGCDGLAHITVYGSDTDVEDGAGIINAAKIHCAKGSKAEAFARANGNPIVYLDDVSPDLDEMDVLCLPADLKAVDAEAFMGSACQAVVVPEGCESIGAKAFADCPNLVYAKVPAGAEIAEDAFDEAAFIDRGEN